MPKISGALVVGEVLGTHTLTFHWKTERGLSLSSWSGIGSHYIRYVSRCVVRPLFITVTVNLIQAQVGDW